MPSLAMPNFPGFVLSARDHAILRLLSRTPATTSLLFKASVTFGSAPFGNERRLRERLQALLRANLVRSWTTGLTGSLENYYKLTPAGYRLLHGDEQELPSRAFFAEIAPARFHHTLTLAELIVHTLVAAHQFRLEVTSFHRENEILIPAGDRSRSPDCHFQLGAGGKVFNVLFELDNSTEPIDSLAHQSIKNKVLTYEAFQDAVAAQAKQHRQRVPRFRVAFLTKTVERGHHILALARQLARNHDRCLCYAASQSEYLAEPDALRQPLFLDHDGRWHSLVQPHPGAAFTKSPVRLAPAIQPGLLA